jgi:universal stress protein E
MRTIRRILVAVSELRATRQAPLALAARIARGCGAELELFHSLSAPVYADTVVGNNRSLAAYGRETQARTIARLERLAAGLRDERLRVSVYADWDYPPFEAIVRRALATKAGLIVAARRGHHRFRAVMGYTDWELLRASPVPVLLTRGRQRRARHKVLAAVDPRHANAKPAGLDRQILGLAGSVGAALGASVQLLHVMEPWLPATPLRDLRPEARAALADLSESCGLGAARSHLLTGSAAVEIPKAARRLHASLLVMGDMSRRGLQRWFVGDTAERIVDELACDVLIVKPARFSSRIARRRRGMYVLANLPMA